MNMHMQLYKVTSWDGLRTLYVVTSSMENALQQGRDWSKNDPKPPAKIEQLTTHKDVVNVTKDE